MGLFRTSASNFEAPDVTAGSYVVTCTGVRPVTITVEQQDKDMFEWSFDLYGPNGPIHIDRLTSLSTGPKSKIWEFLVALLGPENVKVDMDFGESELVGHSALGTMGTSEKGKFGLLGLVPLPMGMSAPGQGNGKKPAAEPTPISPKRQAAAAPARPTVRGAVGTADDEDDLPF